MITDVEWKYVRLFVNLFGLFFDINQLWGPVVNLLCVCVCVREREGGGR